MPEPSVNVFRVVGSLSKDVESLVDDLFTYHPWNPEQVAAGTKVREAIATAFKVILENVPSGPRRTKALQALIDARQDANNSITFGGQY